LVNYTKQNYVEMKETRLCQRRTDYLDYTKNEDTYKVNSVRPGTAVAVLSINIYNRTVNAHEIFK